MHVGREGCASNDREPTRAVRGDASSSHLSRPHGDEAGGRGILVLREEAGTGKIFHRIRLLNIGGERDGRSGFLRQNQSGGVEANAATELPLNAPKMARVLRFMIVRIQST